MILKTEAIVLKSFDFRETSRIATFFTKEYGKVKGVLKGIRKDPKKFGSSVDRFSINDIVFYHYSRTDLHLISHCDLKQFFFPIRQDLKRNIAANYVLELVDVLLPVEQANQKIYSLILEYLNALESTVDIEKLVHILQIKILLLSGFKPHLDSCVKCREKILYKAKFSLSAGGLVCSRCVTLDSKLISISQGTIASIIHVESNRHLKDLRLGLTQTVRKELKYILNNFLVFHLDKNLKSSRFVFKD